MNTITWKRKSEGNATWHESECKRFSIIKNCDGRKRPQGWIVFDRKRPSYTSLATYWSEHCDTLDSAKRKAARSLRDFPVAVEGGAR